jgi:hypothetical protein
VLEQEALEQVASEQGLSEPPSEKRVLETRQGVPEQTTATTSTTQGGLPTAVARGKAATMTSTARLNQEQQQADVV